MELESSSEAAEEVEDKRSKMGSNHVQKRENSQNEKKIKKKKSKYAKKLGCFRSDHDIPTVVEKSNGHENFDMESAGNRPPNHLVVMVNGIIGSAQNWRFAAKKFVKNYPQDVIVHCSECNSAMLTFDGVDVMGRRLADEVISVIKRHPGLQKISFIGHSLGGLVARYAIAKLYSQDCTKETCHESGESDGSKDQCREEKVQGKIAGLEPMNFISSATPHLGSRGHRQVPLFCGIHTLEKVASHLSWFLGRTGKHLFLTDSDDGKPPLLLQMANDCEYIQFIPALRSFKRRVAYANARFDHLVGWGTSSLRRRSELPKRQHLSRNGRYPHIVNEEMARTDSSQREASLEVQVNGHRTDSVEERMIQGLTSLSWERVDVSFGGSKQRFLAHSTIQVKTYFLNSDGADVIQHMIDKFML